MPVQAVSTHTGPAPAFFKALQQDSAVAPVV
jgi:hypothetical protein